MEKYGFKGLEIAPGLFFNHSKDPFKPTRNEINERISEIKSHNINIISIQSLLFGVQNAYLFKDEPSLKIFENAMKKVKKYV